MNKSIKISYLFFGIFFFQPVISGKIIAETAEQHIKQGDAFAAAFDNEKALEEYKAAFTADSSNCTVLWKIAEAYVNLGEEAEQKLKPQYFYTGEKWARRAVAQCPDEANAHFFVAVTSGRLALHEGGKQKVNRSREVKEEAEKTLELDRDHHGAYHALARWHREIAKLSWLEKAAAKIIYGGVPPGASREAAIENFKKAIEIAPEWINHHRQLGKTYMEMEEWEFARQEFEKVLQLPIKDHQDQQNKEECRKLLKEVEKKLED